MDSHDLCVCGICNHEGISSSNANNPLFKTLNILNDGIRCILL